jgi:cullin 1
MHGLLGRIPEGLDPLRAQFEVATKASGLSATERIAGDKPEAVEPKAYVDAILGVYQKYSDLVKKSFRGEAGFNAALDKACREFINQNAVTGKSNQKSPELLAKYSDQLLKKTNKVGEETDLNSALVQTVSPSLLLYTIHSCLHLYSLSPVLIEISVCVSVGEHDDDDVFGDR